MDNPKYKINLKTLHVLLILSFIYTGSWLLFDFSLGCSNPEARAAQLEIYNTMAEKNADYSVYSIFLEHQQTKPQWYCVLCTILHATSIVGMVLMWKIRKNGIHCYALSKLLLMVLPLLFLDRSFVGIGDIMIGVLFIAYYYFLLKALGAFGGDSPTNEDLLPADESDQEGDGEDE